MNININTSRLVEIILNMIIGHHSLLNLIIIDKNLLFISKFWLLLCYFLNIK